MRNTIRDFYGKILGYIDEEPNGDKRVYDFYHRLKGRYRKADNTTRDFYGRVVARGDNCSVLLNM